MVLFNLHNRLATGYLVQRMVEWVRASGPPVPLAKGQDKGNTVQGYYVV